MKTSIVILLFAIVLAVQGRVPTRADVWASRIVGGQNATIRQFSYQVAILNDNNLVCGGSLIECNWVLTAAHCIDEERQRNITIRAGSASSSRGGQTRKAWRIWVHHDYDPETKESDLALIDVEFCFDLNDDVQLIPLARSSPRPGSAAVTSGWGLTSWPIGQQASTLQSLDVRTISAESCAARLSNAGLPVTANNTCTTSPAGQGACKRDGGGPLVSNGVQIGVSSWGVPCATGAPDVYTDVAPFVRWVMRTMWLR